jgi:LPS-assembly protein
MITRSRIFITAALLCHLLLAREIVTSQTLPPPGEPQAALPAATANSMQKEDVTIHAVEQEKEGSIYQLRGRVRIDYRNYILQADEMTYNADTGDSTAEGHVLLEGGPYDEHLEASHGTYNIRTQIGTFYSVLGTLGLRGKQSRYVLTSTNPFAFSGKIVEKHGPAHYLVRQGTVTTCELPHPKWQFHAQRVVVDVDGTAKIYQSNFRLFGIPVFYFPYVTHPVQQERQSGLLIPSVGNSSTKGYIAGESVYWAFNRSMDATIAGEYYSKRGWAQQAVFRMRPSDSSYVYFNYTGVVDRGIEIGGSLQNQGGEDARLAAEHPFGTVRGVADVDYLSSFVYRLAFTEVYTQAIDSEVRSQIFLSNTTNGFHFNALAERYQDFEVCIPPPQPPTNPPISTGCSTITQTELIRVLHTPSFFVSSEERRLGDTPIYFSFESAAEGLQRRQTGLQPGEAGLRTAPLVGRLDLAPTLSMPLLWQGWSLRPALTLRDTFYTQRFGAQPSNPEGGVIQDQVLNRKSVEASFDLLPPALSRVFERPWLGRKWKHVIESRMRYDYVTGINNFPDVVRFDYADVPTNTNEIEYSVVNRLYAKRQNFETDCDVPAMSTLTVGAPPQVGAVPWELPPTPDRLPCAVGPREVASWEIGQKYFFDPTFGNALVPGLRNVFTSTADFTGVAFLDEARRFAPIISRLRIETSPRTTTEWDLDYDFKNGRITGSTAMVNYHYGPFTVGGGDAFLRVLDATSPPGPPGPTDFHQFQVVAGYGQLNKRGLSAASSFGFDANHGYLQYASAQASYNWDCCGLNLEYRRFALGAVRNENQYRFSFTLANVGAFGNLRRQERLY